MLDDFDDIISQFFMINIYTKFREKMFGYDKEIILFIY